MSLFVNTKVSSLNAQRQLFDSGNALGTSFERLSSGFRINRAADDAAGLQITDRFTPKIQGLNQPVRNANDAISLVQTTEGALGESTVALQRIRQLAIQSQNGSNSSADKTALQQEVITLLAELSRIGADTQFAGKNILSGGFSAAFQVGANAGQTISVNLSSSNGASFEDSDLGVGTVDITTTSGASSALTAIDTAISSIGAQRAELVALQNRLQSTIRNLSNVVENLSGAKSRIKDTDFVTETANLTRNQIIQQASTTVLARANQRP